MSYPVRGGKPRWKIALEEERENRLPNGTLIGAFGTADPEVDYLLGEDGPIAQALPHYRVRNGQIHLAQLMHHSVRLRKVLLGEAGTGIGKSLAYLIIGILHALRTNMKVVVATANLALQDQLCKKDLPFLQEVLREHFVEEYGRNFGWGLMKGKSNSACMLKANSSNELPLGFEVETDIIEDWLERTETGDIAELPFDLKQDRYWPLKQAYTADGEEDCPGQLKCDYGQDCFYYLARARANEADIIIVNHALVVIDEELGRVLLPPYDLLIVDEAHQLEDYVRSMTERTLGYGRCNRIFKKATKLLREDLDAERGTATEFFREAEVAVRKKQTGSGQIDLTTGDLSQKLLDLADSLAGQLDDLRSRLERLPSLHGLDGKQQGKAEALARAVSQLRHDFQSLATPGKSCLWAEVTDTTKPPILKLTLVDISEWCKAHLWCRPAILTSATLATAKGEEQFSYQKATLGLTMPLEVAIDSPYEYRRQALYYLPCIPESVLDRHDRESHQQSSHRYAEAIAPHIYQALEASQGRAFVLFTSYSVMQATREALGALPWESYCQGDMAKGALVKWFKTAANPVLFATSSFWEGVDVPGEALSCVIIDRLPVPNPSQPVYKARAAKLGKRAFWELGVPQCTMKLKQAVGRLIRRETDRGLIVLLDPRFHTKAYARQMLSQLPGAPVVGVTTLAAESLSVVPIFLANAPREPRSSEEQWAAQALATLTDLDPDRAGARNDVGFNGADTAIGHSLAQQLVRGGLTPKQWSTAVEMCRKYHRQVGRPEEVAS